MSRFARRQYVPASPRSAAGRGGSPSSGDALPFSYIALIGAAVTCALANVALQPLLMKALASVPEVRGMGPGELKMMSSFTWWLALASGLVQGTVLSFIAHRIGRLLGKSDLWIFALAGLAFLPFALFGGAPEPGEPRLPLLFQALSIIKGPLATTAYWFIAKRLAG